MQTKKVIVVGTLCLSLLSFGGVIFAQLTISTNLQNAIQTIRQIILTTDGTSSGSKVIHLNYDDQGSISFSGEVVSPGIVIKGVGVSANGADAIAIGNDASANGESSLAMGTNTQANGDYSTSMGYITQANGDRSTTMGAYTRANGENATAMGNNTIASGDNSLVFGKFNIADASKIFVVGNGTDDSNRLNLITLGTGGNFWVLGSVTAASMITDLISANQINATGINVGTLNANQINATGISATYISGSTINGDSFCNSNGTNCRSMQELGLWLTGSAGVIYYNSGYVGIGTGTPQAKLHVIGNVISDAYYYKSITNNDDLFTIKGTQRVDSSQPGDIYYTGQVGIGAANPTEKLDVNGNVAANAYYYKGSIPDDVLYQFKGATGATGPQGPIGATGSQGPSGVTVESDPKVGSLTINYIPKWNGTTLVNTTINEFSTDGTMAGNSDSAVPTEKAVKTYVDNQTLNVCNFSFSFDRSTLGATKIGKRQNGFHADIFDNTPASAINTVANVDFGNSNGIVNGCYGRDLVVCYPSGGGNSYGLKGGYIGSNVETRILENYVGDPKFAVLWGMSQTQWDDTTDLGGISGNQYASRITVEVDCIYK